MSRVIDITDRLNFEENPKIKIKGVELEINADAETMLKIMGLSSNNPTAEDVTDMRDLIFTEESNKKLKELNLNFKDFQTVVMTAIDVANGGNGEDKAGEQ